MDTSTNLLCCSNLLPRVQATTDASSFSHLCLNEIATISLNYTKVVRNWLDEQSSLDPEFESKLRAYLQNYGDDFTCWGWLSYDNLDREFKEPILDIRQQVLNIVRLVRPRAECVVC